MKPIEFEVTFTLSPAMQDKVQGLSIQLGELYAQIYRMDHVGEVQEHALDAFRALRRCLPMTVNDKGQDRHEGHSAASDATQGYTL